MTVRGVFLTAVNIPALRLSGVPVGVPVGVPNRKTAFPASPFGGQKRRFLRVRTRGFEPPRPKSGTRSLVWRVCQFRHVRSRC